MKTITLLLKAIFIILISNILNFGVFADSKKVKIYISKVISHPALNSTTAGIIDTLKEAGYNDQKAEIIVDSAQGSATLAAQIASKFVSANPDIVIGVATISAQSLSKFAKQDKLKLIFSTVTDPLGANLVDSIDNPGNNTSGVSNYVPLEPQLKLFKEILPNMKKLGFLYNPGEANSISLIKELEQICPKYGLELVKQVASKTGDVAQSMAALVSKSDAIFISNDSTALSAMPTIVKVATTAKIPVFVSDTDAVELGPIAALGPNQYEVGKQTGRMVLKVLKGIDINKIPIEFPKKTELYLNLKSAKILGIVTPIGLEQQATKIIK